MSLNLSYSHFRITATSVQHLADYTEHCKNLATAFHNVEKWVQSICDKYRCSRIFTLNYDIGIVCIKTIDMPVCGS